LPDPARPPGIGVLSRLRDRARDSYPAAVVRRFFELELLDRSFGLAAQVFVALLPLIIVIVSVMLDPNSDFIPSQISERFGLAGAADSAVRMLFSAPGPERAISWLAVVVSLLSAFSLSRRLSRTYGMIFGLPSLRRNQLWRGIAWIVLQMLLFGLASELRSVRRDEGDLLAMLAGIVLLVVWFFGDMAGVKLLVPSISRRLLVPTALLGSVGSLALSVWSAAFMPRTFSAQAEQFGPIGVTFALFTLILAATLVIVVAPLMVAVWDHRRSGAPELPPTDDDYVAT
jgi:hypothetical protein